jgi:plastocyanin
VSLIPLDGPAKITPPTEPRVIAQKNTEFTPYVTVIAVGTSVSFPNQEEKISHQVFANSETKNFDLPLHKPGKAGTVVFDRAGVAAIGCNIHDWMIAYVAVVSTPWFGQSGATGGVTIPGVTAGRYRAEIWQPRLEKIVTRELTVTDAASPAVELTLELGKDKRLRRPIATPGAGYK